MYATAWAGLHQNLGLELLVETARLWRSLGQHDAMGRFRIEKTVMARHRGMITSARIAALTELEEDWITALPGPAIKSSRLPPRRGPASGDMDPGAGP